jgi:hypothetical protein
MELVDPGSHHYLPEDRLRAVVSDVLSADPERVITYCGGAIAASSDAFVFSLLGVENGAIYDGSMSKWAADPSLPLVMRRLTTSAARLIDKDGNVRLNAERLVPNRQTSVRSRHDRAPLSFDRYISGSAGFVKERVTGIEPASRAWELHDMRRTLRLSSGFG